MSENKKTKSYLVQAVLHLMVATEVRAKDLDEALEIAKTMKESDFVDIHGDYVDGNMSVTGVYEAAPSGL